MEPYVSTIRGLEKDLARKEEKYEKKATTRNLGKLVEARFLLKKWKKEYAEVLKEN